MQFCMQNFACDNLDANPYKKFVFNVDFIYECESVCKKFICNTDFTYEFEYVCNVYFTHEFSYACNFRM